MSRMMFVLVFSAGWAAAQSAPVRQDALHFSAYLAEVARSNPALAAQRNTLPVSQAQVILARVFPDPVLSAGLGSLDVSNVGAQNSVVASASIPIEWPGKRSARVALSEANVNVASAEFEDFARMARSRAANAYIDAVLARRVLEHKRAAEESLHRVVVLNEKRMQEGAGSEIVVLQARVEARRFKAELLMAVADAQVARAALEEQMGRQPTQALLSEVEGSLVAPPMELELETLVAEALKRRPDLQAREQSIEAAKAQLRLAKANRGPDLAVGLGWQYYAPGATGSAFQGPGYHAVSAQLSVPLPFSKIADGETRSATAQQQLEQSRRTAAGLGVEMEVRTAFIRYQAARDRLAQFDEALLRDSDRLLEMARYSFEQGASRLVELLSAQRSWIDVHLTYEAALADQARALVALETAAGLWNIEW